ncbi:MAG: hypothetical protein K0S07_1337 [Chlamydiales bacterium]|nr:hypothetical protein [Chlamydiales bacterium]
MATNFIQVAMAVLVVKGLLEEMEEMGGTLGETVETEDRAQNEVAMAVMEVMEANTLKVAMEEKVAMALLEVMVETEDIQEEKEGKEVKDMRDKMEEAGKTANFSGFFAYITS